MSDLDLCPLAVRKVSSAVEDQPQTLQDANALLLKEKEYCDVTFTFPNQPDRIEAHEIFLKARSPVFKQIFRKRMRGIGRGREIEISEATPGRFQEFLEFIYMDKFQVNVAGALDLLPLAQKYKVQPLMKKCEELLKTEMEIEDAVQVFETARRYGRDDLVDRAGEIMIQSLAYLLEIDALKDAEEATVSYILERDDLNVKEVDLFGFIVNWGKGRVAPSEGAHLLQDKLKKFIPLIRYAAMTPQEFTAVVSPTGLLSLEEMLSVYSYSTGDEAMRKDMKVKFNTAPRKVEACVDFYAGDENDFWQSGSTSSHPLKQCMSFQVQICKKLREALKKPAITGLKLKWPSRSVTYSSKTDTTLNFSVFIKECSGAGKDQSFIIRFHKVVLNCKDGDEDEILVEPPIELTSYKTYFITVEDLSQHHQRSGCHRSDNYTYSGKFSPCDLRPTASVDLGGVDVKLNNIQKENRIPGFQYSTQSYHHINVIRGIKISLV